MKIEVDKNYTYLHFRTWWTFKVYWMLRTGWGYTKYQICNYSIRIIGSVSNWITQKIYNPIYGYVENYNANLRVNAVERRFQFRSGYTRVSSIFRFRDYRKYLEDKKYTSEKNERRMQNMDLIVKYSEKTRISQTAILDEVPLDSIIIEIKGFSTVKEYFLNTLPSWKKIKENLKYFATYLSSRWLWKVTHKIAVFRLKFFRRKKWPHYWYIATRWAEIEEARRDKIRKKKRAEIMSR